MPYGNSSDAVLRPDLAAAAFEYSLSEASRGYIGTLALPIFPSSVKSAEYPVIPAKALLSMPDTKRAPRSAYKRGDWPWDMKNFTCKENGWEEPLDDSEAAMFRQYLDGEVVCTHRAMGIIERTQEKRIADALFNESTFSPHSVGNGWLDSANATPLEDVNAGKAEIEDTTGLTPNTLILNRQLFRGLGVCDAVIDRIKFTNPNVVRGEVPAALLAQYFGVDQLLVAGGVYDKAAKGKTLDVEKIWSSTYAMLAVVSPGGQDMYQPSLGRTFAWIEDMGGEERVVVEAYRDESARSEIIRARQHTHEVVQMTAAGYLLKGVNATGS